MTNSIVLMHYLYTLQACSFEIQTYLENSSIHRQIKIYILVYNLVIYNILFLNYFYLLG